MAEVYEAQWNLQLNVFCDKCEQDINLLNESENRKQLMYKLGEHIDGMALECPHCGNSILITVLAD